ncbi:MAG: hypothetical protein AAF514_15180, partial [Verrucomicrobiota bacterium]
MRKAHFFDTALDFCDFVRAQGGRPHPIEGNLFELHRVVHPDRPGDNALVLLNCGLKQENSLPGPAEVIDVEVTNGHLLGASPDPAPIIETRFARTLVEFVNLKDWNAFRAEKAGKGPVFFWVRDQNCVATLVRDSLHLENDRIQYAGLDSKEGKAMLLRIEQPSHFLVQRCLEDYAESISLFYRETDDVFVSWGLEHPLAGWW